MSERRYCVYIVTNKRHGTLYIGETGDIAARIYGYRTKSVPGFAVRYGLDRLVWVESFPTWEAARQREKTMKRWPRAWKINLIEDTNPDWRDLYDRLYE